MDLDKKQNIALESYENALVIRFSRPEIRNPLSIEVLHELDEIIENVSANSSIKNIIFTGTDDIFASGANLREIAEVTAETAREFALRGQALMNKITESPQTTIAAVNGPCFGGALDLALACDIRIAAPRAVFCHPGANLGIITGWGGTQRLPRLIGEARALEMFLTAKQVSAEEALRIGLITEVTENPADRIAQLSENL
jgi:enoyl-CoA hydratase/carnithine racemase